MTTFRTELSPLDAFNVLESLRVQGALNPACKASWTRQVDERGTCIRLTIFKGWFKRRNFFEVGRSSRICEDDEQYAFANMSMAPELVDELLPLSEGPEGSAGVTTRASLSSSQIHVAGVLVHVPDCRGTKVHIVSDIDFGAANGDQILRGHIISTSKLLRQACASYIAQAGESLEPSPFEGGASSARRGTWSAGESLEPSIYESVK